MIYLFDLGNVLYKINPQKFQQNFFNNLANPQKATQIEKDELFKKYETGKIPTETFLARLQEKYFPHLNQHQISTIWNSILVGNHPYATRLLKRLKQEKHRLSLLSDTNELHYETLYSEAQTFLRLFDKIFLSYKLGLSKPNPEIFDMVCKSIDASPQQITFFDDSFENVQVARTLGFQSFLITQEKDISFYFPTF